MAKSSGLGDQFYLGGNDLSTDTGSLDTISKPLAALNVTGINKSAPERLGGLAGGEISFTSFFDNATVISGGYLGEHGVLSALPRTDLIASYFHGATPGNVAASMIAKQINYDPTRATDGMLTFKTQCLSNAFSLEWGCQGTPGIRSDTTATNGTGVDFQATPVGTATLSFGLQAYLHVFSFTGTSCTVKLQGSSDNGVGDAFADITGATFGAQTATGASRIATATNLALERYFRVATTGTFSQCSFAVVVVPNMTVPAF